MNSIARSCARAGGLGWVMVFAALAGCANGDASGGDPGARPLPPGQTCQGLKGELDRMVSKGTAQGSESGRYNQLLGQYLGARCHV